MPQMHRFFSSCPNLKESLWNERFFAPLKLRSEWQIVSFVIRRQEESLWNERFFAPQKLRSEWQKKLLCHSDGRRNLITTFILAPLKLHSEWQKPSSNPQILNGIWCLMLSTWCFGAWNLELGIWCLVLVIYSHLKSLGSCLLALVSVFTTKTQTPPRHPGLFLRTWWPCRICSLAHVFAFRQEAVR